MDATEKAASGPLRNIRVLDLSRVLAGPVATQILGDLGADILKIEKPGAGDDTRAWGPPFLLDAKGNETSESAYYLSANRNKRSFAVDIATKEGQARVHELLKDCDVLIENFKVDGLKKYGLSYDDLKEKYPRLVYCSITGFGQTGPLAHEPGYDFMIQALSGLMACTGAKDQPPTKTGVAVCDYVTGLYAVIGIVSALQARQFTGRGQHVDLALMDCTLAMLTNIAQFTLTSGENPPRVGNAHTTIVPYQAFEASDGWMVVAVGNDTQFARLCAILGHAEWAQDARFTTNSARVRHRADLIPMIEAAMRQKPVAHWVEECTVHDVPHGPVNTMTQAFEMEQVKARDMVIEMSHPYAPHPVKLVGSPLKLSDTPVDYRHAPPPLGFGGDQVQTDRKGAA